MTRTGQSRADDGRDRLRRELARGTVELAVLSALGSTRRYGYELLTLLRDLSGGATEVKEGTLYPLLHRLEDAGLVLATWEGAKDREPARKYYRLTAAGRAQLSVMRAEWDRLASGMQQLLGALEEAKR